MTNHFAIALARELAILPETNLEFAARAGLPPTNLSIFVRIGRNSRKCGSAQLSKILAALDEDARVRLVCAWLRDQIPAEIQPGQISLGPTTARIHELPDEPWPDIDPAFKDAAMYLLRRAKSCPEIREILVNLAGALRGNQ